MDHTKGKEDWRAEALEMSKDELNEVVEEAIRIMKDESTTEDERWYQYHKALIFGFRWSIMAGEGEEGWITLDCYLFDLVHGIVEDD